MRSHQGKFQPTRNFDEVLVVYSETPPEVDIDRVQVDNNWFKITRILQDFPTPGKKYDCFWCKFEEVRFDPEKLKPRLPLPGRSHIAFMVAQRLILNPTESYEKLERKMLEKFTCHDTRALLPLIRGEYEYQTETPDDVKEQHRERVKQSLSQFNEKMRNRNSARFVEHRRRTG